VWPLANSTPVTIRAGSDESRMKSDPLKRLV
jgi:hypothetical protein